MIVPGKLIIIRVEDNNYTKVNGFNYCFALFLIVFKVCQKTNIKHFVQLSAVMLHKNFKIHDNHLYLGICVNAVKTIIIDDFVFQLY